MFPQNSIWPENRDLIRDEAGSQGAVWVGLDGLIAQLIDVAELESLIELFKCLYLMYFGNLDRITELIFTIHLHLEDDEVSISCHNCEFHIQPRDPFGSDDGFGLLMT